jgi:hypothetical protein
MEELNIRIKNLSKMTNDIGYRCEVCKEYKEVVVIGDQGEPDYDVSNGLICRDCTQLVLDNWEKIRYLR